MDSQYTRQLIPDLLVHIDQPLFTSEQHAEMNTEMRMFTPLWDE